MPLDGYAFLAPPADGQPIELGIRPEHIEVNAAGAAAVVEMVEPMGSDQLAWLRFGGAPLSLRLSAEAGVKTGDNMGIVLPPRRMSLFDAASGARL